MAVHLSEEEQMENLRRWWAENGKTTVAAVVLAVLGYFGWEGWQDRQRANAEVASALYQGLLESLQANQEQPASEEQLANVRHLGGQLKEQFESNLYASQAALFLAQQAVQAGDLERAAAELQWVIDRDVEPALTLLARARLARLRMALGEMEAALALLQEADNTAFISIFAELRGDIFVDLGRIKEARAAYGLAMDNLVSGQEGRAQLIQIKLNDLQASDATAASPESPAPEASATGENS